MSSIHLSVSYVTGRQVPQDPGDEFLDFVVRRFPEQPDEGGDAAGRFNRSLVLVVLPSVR